MATRNTLRSILRPLIQQMEHHSRLQMVLASMNGAGSREKRAVAVVHPSRMECQGATREALED